LGDVDLGVVGVRGVAGDVEPLAEEGAEAAVGVDRDVDADPPAGGRVVGEIVAGEDGAEVVLGVAVDDRLAVALGDGLGDGGAAGLPPVEGGAGGLAAGVVALGVVGEVLDGEGDALMLGGAVGLEVSVAVDV
jgi:hypothetical protein